MQFAGSLDYLRSACAYIYGHIEDYSYIDISVNGRPEQYDRSIHIEVDRRGYADDNEGIDFDEVRAKLNVFIQALDDDTVDRVKFFRAYRVVSVSVRDVNGQVVTRECEFGTEPDTAPESITELA